MSNFLSQEDARNFVATKLGVDLTIEDKYKLLSEIVSRFMVKVPFQNLTLMAVPFEKREAPSSEECIKCVLEGYGGLCVALNFSMWCILKALDLNADLLLGSVCVPDSNDHSIVLVRNLMKDGDNWLVDVGFGNPFFRPISMDFETESEVITQSHVTYKYQKRGDTYICLQKVGKSMRFPTVENGWGHAYYFNLKPTDHQVISRSIDSIIYKTRTVESFHASPRVVCVDSNMKGLIFKDGYLLKAGEDGKLHQEDIEGDVVDVVHELFPAIPKVIIREAMNEYERVKKPVSE